MNVDEAYKEIRSGVSDKRLEEILDELWEEADNEGSSRAHFDL